MSEVDFSAWEFYLENPHDVPLPLADGTSIPPHGERVYQGLAPDSATGAGQVIDALNSAGIPVSPKIPFLDYVIAALKQAPGKKLRTPTDFPSTFDPQSKDGMLDQPERPEDLIVPTELLPTPLPKHHRPAEVRKDRTTRS
jgi:hypothetical protein